jgi:hypothetical protein
MMAPRLLLSPEWVVWATIQRTGNQVSVPAFMSGTSRVLPSGMSAMSAADWNMSERSLGGSFSETSSNSLPFFPRTSMPQVVIRIQACDLALFRTLASAIESL